MGNINRYSEINLLIKFFIQIYNSQFSNRHHQVLLFQFTVLDAGMQDSWKYIAVFKNRLYYTNEYIVFEM